MLKIIQSMVDSPTFFLFRPGEALDTLSDVLSLLRPNSFMFRGIDVCGAWSLQFPATESIRCYAVQRGQCWLVVDGVAEAVHLKKGDCFLLTRNQSFRLASDTNLPPVDVTQFFSVANEGGVVTFNGGGDLVGIGGYFEFVGRHAGILLGLLPAIVHIRNEQSKVALLASMDLMMQELRESQPGGSLIARHLAHMMLVLALRAYLSERSQASVGWLFALADKQIGAAINAVHGHPGQPWTLQALADLACMSRSTFALRFKETVGTAPMGYLLRWRMMLAGDRLVNSSDPISAIALRVGYESESSFSTAFKRTMGCSPRQYARGRGVPPISQHALAIAPGTP